MTETNSLKALSSKVFQRNRSGNKSETNGFFDETNMEQKVIVTETAPTDLRQSTKVIDISACIDFYEERAGTYEFLVD